jgi:phosphoribosylanthranilate isomerase
VSSAAKKAMTKVKICGITNLEDALLSAKFGADALGFNFYEKSPRYVTSKKASEIIEQLPKGVMKVGVFVNESVERICKIVEIAGLDAIQLHGEEDNRFIEEVHMMSGLPVIKAFRISLDFNPDSAKHSSAEAVLLDKYSSREPGGTGETFDWKIAKLVSNLVDRVYLAGGLTADNVADAIGTVHPYAVDVCSRIETKPGKKDDEKLERFIAAVKEAI